MNAAAHRRPLRHCAGLRFVSAGRRPGRGRRGGRRGRLLGRHGGRRRPWRGLGLFLRPGRASWPRAAAPPAAIRQRPGSARGDRRSASWFGRGHHPHRHGLRLIARQREAHREFAGRHRLRAGGPAGLAQRCPGLGAGRLGFELHGGCRRRRFHEARRVELHPARHARASGKAECAGCNRDNSFHGQLPSLMQPSGRVTPNSRRAMGAACNRQCPPHRVPPP